MTTHAPPTLRDSADPVGSLTDRLEALSAENTDLRRQRDLLAEAVAIVAPVANVKALTREQFFALRDALNTATDLIRENQQ